MAQNSQLTAKPKKKRGPGKPLAKGYDPRRNVGGRPKSNQTWCEIYKEVIDSYPEELDGLLLGKLATKAKGLPRSVQIKYVQAANIAISLAGENPSPSLLSEMLNRLEGKVPDNLKMENTLSVSNLETILKAVYGSDIDSGQRDTDASNTNA